MWPNKELSPAGLSVRRYRGASDAPCKQRRTAVTSMIERPMAIGPTPAAGAFEDLLRTVEELETPDGYKAELIRGKIVVSPWSRLRYKKAMKSLRRQLEPHAPEGHDVDVAPFLYVFPGSAPSAPTCTSPTSPPSRPKAVTPMARLSPSSPS